MVKLLVDKKLTEKIKTGSKKPSPRYVYTNKKVTTLADRPYRPKEEKL